MGLEIKRNKEGLYKAKSSISDESVSDGWLTEDEFKKILIEREYSTFIQNVIKIDLEFPNGYYVNGKHQYDENDGHISGSKFLLENWNNDNVIEEKFEDICKRLKIKI